MAPGPSPPGARLNHHTAAAASTGTVCPAHPDEDPPPIKVRLCQHQEASHPAPMCRPGCRPRVGPGAADTHHGERVAEQEEELQEDLPPHVSGELHQPTEPVGTPHSGELTPAHACCLDTPHLHFTGGPASLRGMGGPPGAAHGDPQASGLFHWGGSPGFTSTFSPQVGASRSPECRGIGAFSMTTLPDPSGRLVQGWAGCGRAHLLHQEHGSA